MSNSLLLTQFMLQLALQMQATSMLLNKTQSEKREPTDEELNSLAGLDDAARARLQAAIDA